ncbi:MAG: nitroreductase family protein [Candidatus Thermoplasmatota archaeon]|nr:nitroreductase family protein [Candidatus Thermoplasmatota archaeon]
MNVYDAICSRRSIRRFTQQPIALDVLQRCVNAARVAPSGGNLQPLEYIVVTDPVVCASLFETLSWAAYLQPKWTPEDQKRPTAYIVILVRETKNPYYQRDVGLAAGNIMLTAEADGLGSCMLCNINKQKIQELLAVPTSRIVDSVIALGFKAEHPVVEERADVVKYWRDDYEALHVPKRPLTDVLHFNEYGTHTPKRTKR